MMMMIKIEKFEKIIEGQNSRAGIIYKEIMIFRCLAPLPLLFRSDFGRFWAILHDFGHDSTNEVVLRSAYVKGR